MWILFEGLFNTRNIFLYAIFYLFVIVTVSLNCSYSHSFVISNSNLILTILPLMILLFK